MSVFKEESIRNKKPAIAARVTVFLKKNSIGWLIMLPSITLFLFFVWVPLFRNVVLAFSKTRGFEAVGFVGFDNFRAVFADPLFASAVTNTFVYAGWSILIGFLIPIVLGLLLSELSHFQGFMRAALYFPSIVSGIAVALLWRVMFDPTSTGFFNVMLNSLGLKSFGFLSNPVAVKPLIVLTMTWRGAGSTALIYLSSLQTVDTQQYEAARIDGAGMLRRMFSVTLPHISGMIRMLFILQLISVFQVFHEPLVMTDGGPNGASYSLLLLAYNYAFAGTPNAGYSAAMGVITAVIIICFTFVYMFLSNPKRRGRAID